jgi:hypothetical protein
MFEIKHMEEAYALIENDVIFVIDKIMNYDYKSFFQSVIISSFLLYGKTMTFMTKNYRSAYNNFEWVRNLDYTAKYSVKYLHSVCFLYKIEPYRLSWYSNFWIEKTSIDQYIFHEILANSEDNVKNCKYCLIDILNENLPDDPIFIGKIMSSIDDEPKYYCRRIDGRETEPDNVYISLFPAIPSDTHFLSVTYKHPEMQTSIDLTINNGWFMEGNEILSRSFIFRELYYQSKSFVFDEKYTLEIIDRNINIIELGYYEYIEIKNDSYEIVDSNKPYDSSIVIVPSMNKEVEEDEYEDEDEAEYNQMIICDSVSYLCSGFDSKGILYPENDHKND